MNQIKENIPSSSMLSKIGKHISQRITGGGKRKHRRPGSQSKQNSCSLEKSEVSPLKLTYSTTVERIKRMKNQQFRPCVGHYKVNYSFIDKNNQRINFKKLIPHFAKDKPSSSFTQTQYNDTPNKISPRITGMQEFDRMTSRQQIKGSIRKKGQDPHQKRFQLRLTDYWSNPKNFTQTVCFQKMMKRKNDIFFKQRQFSPDYDVNCQFGKKRLALNIIPFQKQSPRDQCFLLNKNCSQLRDIHESPSGLIRTIKFDKILPRYKQSLLPSYLDTGINTRSSLNERNWQTLKMNCYQARNMDAQE